MEEERDDDDDVMFTARFQLHSINLWRWLAQVVTNGHCNIQAGASPMRYIIIPLNLHQLCSLNRALYIVTDVMMDILLNESNITFVMTFP